MKKNHKILKGLVALSSCLSAIGAGGNVSLAMDPEQTTQSNMTTKSGTSVCGNKRSRSKSVDSIREGVAKVPAEKRITDAVVEDYESAIRSLRRRRGRAKSVVTRLRGGTPIIINGDELKSREDVNEKVSNVLIKASLENYYDNLKTKTFEKAKDNDFSDWKFLQPKFKASNIRKSYEDVTKNRRNLSPEFKGLSDKIPKDEVNLFVQKVSDAYGLKSQKYPEDLYNVLLDSPESNRSFEEGESAEKPQVREY